MRRPETHPKKNWKYILNFSRKSLQISKDERFRIRNRFWGQKYLPKEPPEALRTPRKAFKSAPEPPEAPKWRPKWRPNPCQNRPTGQMVSPRPSRKRLRGPFWILWDTILDNLRTIFTSRFSRKKTTTNMHQIKKWHSSSYNAYTISLKTLGKTLQYSIVHQIRGKKHQDAYCNKDTE